MTPDNEKSSNFLVVSRRVSVPLAEIELKPIRAQGAGGQNVNKVETALHLRFDIPGSSLPDTYKNRLLNLKDKRITRDGIIVIKSQQYRTQERNREAAYDRLRELLSSVFVTRVPRLPTKPSKGAKRRRLEEKTRRGKQKALRGRVSPGEE